MAKDTVTKYTHLVGRAGKDIEARPASKPLAKFTLAVEVGYDTEKRETVTQWYDVAAWDALAEALFFGDGAPRILKGQRIWVAGRTSVYTSPSGDRPQINAREVGVVERFLVGKAGASPVMLDEEDEMPEAEVPMDGITDGEW